MMVDKEYCINSFLMYRTIADDSKCFTKKLPYNSYDINFSRSVISDSFELERVLREKVHAATSGGESAIALSGGIDSAILAKFMPKGSVAYTFKCLVPGVEVTDESAMAARYAEECGLEHRVVEIYWEDVEEYLPVLMKSKGAPLHSIEVQIYKAALKVKGDGFSKLIFGESADCLYGGLDGLLSRDYNIEEITNRYSSVLPDKVLKSPCRVMEPYFEYYKDGYFDTVGFLRDFFFKESMGSYENPCNVANVELVAPFAETLPSHLDIKKIREGEPKYLIREVFRRLYPDFVINRKLPMPRPTNEWFKSWGGPKRNEFLPNCVSGLTGDQKWLVYCLENFLDLIESEGLE